MPKTTTDLLTVALTCAIFAGKDVLSMDLNQFQWKNRLLFIFAPRDDDSSYRALHSEISTQRGEVSERDLVVFSIFEIGPSFMETTRIASGVAKAIRNKFAAPLGRFSCILVGKDGGVKLRQEAPIKLMDIFALIDAMPMRREEMRQKKSN